MLLAIDTATYRASVALHDGERVRGECTWEAVDRHTVTLVPRITELLHATEITAEDLSGVAVCVGPGSYTGTRIGVSVAKGLAVTRHLPLVGLRTLDILAAGQPPDPKPLYALFGAGRKRVGFVRYRWQEAGWQAETEVEIVSWGKLPEQITEAAIVVGEIAPRGREALTSLGDRVTLPAPAWHLRRAGFLADLAWQRLRAGYRGDPTQVVPIYAR